MNVYLLLLATPVILGVAYKAYPSLIGAWYCTGHLGCMSFLTRRGAERYRAGGGLADPYRRGLQGPITFRPGLLLRRAGR